MAAHHQGAAHACTADPDIEVDNIELLHEIVHCPLNRLPHMDAMAYAQRCQLTETVGVPGSEPSATRVRALPDILLVLRRWYQCFWFMHRSGLCLRGQFGAQNVLVYSNHSVRLNGVHFVEFSKPGGDLDYRQFVASVEQFFLLRESVPGDIREWLELIREGVNGYEYAIRYSTALMEPKQAFDWVMEARGALEQLRFTMDMHADLVDWNLDSYCVNALMRLAREHVDIHTGRPAELEPDVRGVLKLTRNCSQHQAKYKERLMVLIMQDDFPGFVARLHMSFFRAGVLHHFRLELTMG